MQQHNNLNESKITISLTQYGNTTEIVLTNPPVDRGELLQWICFSALPALGYEQTILEEELGYE